MIGLTSKNGAETSKGKRIKIFGSSRGVYHDARRDNLGYGGGGQKDPTRLGPGLARRLLIRDANCGQEQIEVPLQLVPVLRQLCRSVGIAANDDCRLRGQWRTGEAMPCKVKWI